MAGVQATSGLTTTKAPFIEQAQAEGRLYIHQPYELYSEANHDAWQRLFTRQGDRWRRYANPRFLQGIDNLCLDANRVPRLDDVNRFLSPLTGFQAKAVSGYVPSFLFFDCLRNRQFPTTITIRDGASLDYLPEPDIFHDIAGHVPMHGFQWRMKLGFSTTRRPRGTSAPRGFQSGVPKRPSSRPRARSAARTAP